VNSIFKHSSENSNISSIPIIEIENWENPSKIHPNPINNPTIRNNTAKIKYPQINIVKVINILLRLIFMGQPNELKHPLTLYIHHQRCTKPANIT